MSFSDTVERIVTPQLSLAAPANHVVQHATIEEIPGLESTELPPTLNTFRENHILRLKELRTDKNDGKIKTTRLIVTNANFNAAYGDPDSYDDNNAIHDFAYYDRKGALTVRSGGAYVGDALRVGGIVGSPLFVNDQPNPIDDNTRVRTYVPSMHAPYIIKIFLAIANAQTTTIDSQVEIGDHYKMVVDIPPDIYGICRRDDGSPRITVQVIPIDNFGVGYHSPAFGLEDYQFLVRVTKLGNYKIILYAERNDDIANYHRFAEYVGTNRYFPVAQDTAP